MSHHQGSVARQYFHIVISCYSGIENKLDDRTLRAKFYETFCENLF